MYTIKQTLLKIFWFWCIYVGFHEQFSWRNCMGTKMYNLQENGWRAGKWNSFSVFFFYNELNGLHNAGNVPYFSVILLSANLVQLKCWNQMFSLMWLMQNRLQVKQLQVASRMELFRNRSLFKLHSLQCSMVLEISIIGL